MSAVGENAVSILLTVACSLCAVTKFSEDCLFLVLIFLLNSSWYECCVLWSALVAFLQKLPSYWNMENV